MNVHLLLLQQRLMIISIIALQVLALATSVESKNACVNVNDTSDMVENTNKNDDLICGVWFAKSTIPGAGVGLFAGKDFEIKQSLLPSGDVVIAVVDTVLHRNKNSNFLWDEYTWASHGLHMEREGVTQKTNVVSPGFGSAVNCVMDLVNVKESSPVNSNMGLHRYNDPGAGAFSTWWNRESIASKPIQAGNELFATYGDGWFSSRPTIGPVPIKGDMDKANKLIESYFRLENSLKSAINPEILQDMWEIFGCDNPWNDTSRVMFAIPKNWDDLRVAGNISLQELKRREHSRSVDWLKEHGECGDWLYVKESTIRQAGRGAFARKRMLEGEVVAPYPLIHLPYRQLLDMFELEFINKTNTYMADKTKKTHTQLLLNYCMGHNESTMLLCPYGTISSHINHNQTLANVKMVWADARKSNHRPEWLNRTLRELYETPHAGLSMNLIATRDIEHDEEIFLDYGDEWEHAWQEHVRNFAPDSMAASYKSAEQMNEETTVLRTEFELLSNPYPSNVQLFLSLAFNVPRKLWMTDWERGTLEGYMIEEDAYYGAVEVLRRDVDAENNTWYTVIPLDTGGKVPETLKPRIRERVPRVAFMFFDKAYTSDALQRNAFRHDVRISDDLVPDVWRNVKSGVDLVPPDD